MADAFPSIPQFYAGRDVFITGASGFVGKVLVERLLSTCPDIGTLHLLLRGKRDHPPDVRLQILKNSPVFDVIRQSRPEQLEKLHVVPGDITHPGLGISDASFEGLKEVSVVFNCAATVRLGETLRLSVQHNTLSVLRLLELADRLTHVAAFVQVSTAYANSEHSTVEERVYPLPRPLSAMVEEALAVPDDAAPQHVKRLISPKPDTYAYTKSMGEAAVQQHEHAGFPRAIFRPTIVISSVRHPFPGWVEGLSSVSGPALLIARGALHVMPCRGTRQADLLPVDLAADALLAVAWETAVLNSRAVRVYNCSTCSNPTTWETVRQRLVASSRRDPAPAALWYPFVVFVTNRLLFAVLSFLAHTAPLHALEYLTRLISPKKRFNFIKLSHTVSATNDCLLYYVTREWVFRTDRLRELRARLCERDRDTYNLDPGSIDWPSCYALFSRGCRRHLAGQADDSLPEARRRMRKLRWLHWALALAALLGAGHVVARCCVLVLN